MDPLTANRYALAAGNPVSYSEWDGHLNDLGGGGSAGTAQTDRAPSACATNSCQRAFTSSDTGSDGPSKRVGRLRKGGDSDASPRTGSIRIERQPGHGEIKINFFISECEAGVFGSLRFRGDCRDPESDAGGPDSRVTIRANFETGELSVYVNYSCRADGHCVTAQRTGINPPPVTDECGTPEQPPSVALCRFALDRAHPPNFFRVTEEDGELRVRFSVADSAVPAWAPAPPLDGQVTLTPAPGSSRVRACYDGDPYPSGEIYQDLGGGPTELATWEEHGALGLPFLGLLGLFRDREVCG